MASYDSDDDDFDTQSYEETNVLLGYASKDSNGETISRLGGRPEWIDSKTPSGALAKCKVCKRSMALLLQLNAELPERFPTHERRLYVFSCRQKSCRRKEGSIRAVRGVRVSGDAPAPAEEKKKAVEEKAPDRKEEQKPAVSTGLGESLFGVKPLAGAAASLNPFSSGGGSAVNPFSKPAEALAAVNPFSSSAKPTEPAPAAQSEPESTKTEQETKALPKTFAETLNLNNDQATVSGPAPPPEPWPQESELPAAYPVSWLADAEYEVLEPTRLPKVEQATVMDVDSADAGGSSGKEDKVTYESTMDTVFQKFADRVGQNPEQCIRYEYAGTPLLYAKGDGVSKLLEQGGEGVRVGKGMPRCERCGAGRVFEVQLMPHAIEVLEEEEEGMEGMDWGTAIVGVCERDCGERGQKVGEAGYVEEWCGVQWEELMGRR